MEFSMSSGSPKTFLHYLGVFFLVVLIGAAILGLGYWIYSYGVSVGVHDQTFETKKQVEANEQAAKEFDGLKAKLVEERNAYKTALKTVVASVPKAENPFARTTFALCDTSLVVSVNDTLVSCKDQYGLMFPATYNANGKLLTLEFYSSAAVVKK